MSMFQLYQRKGIWYADVKTNLGKRRRVSLHTGKKGGDGDRNFLAG